MVLANPSDVPCVLKGAHAHACTSTLFSILRTNNAFARACMVPKRTTHCCLCFSFPASSLRPIE